MKHLIIVFLIGLIIFGGSTVKAQDGSQPLKCTAQDTQGVIQVASDALATAKDLDAAGQYDAAVNAKKALMTLDTICLGLDFEGNAEKVSDPVYVPKGIYRVTATTEGFFMLRPTILEGNCDPDGITLFNLSSGEGNTGAQAILKSEGCVALWEISNVSAPYSLKFEKMK